MSCLVAKHCRLAWSEERFDGQLFLVRHLLILRDITRNIDLAQKDEPRTGGVDAYNMTGWYTL
jgi:hypothetical protein